MTWAEYWNGDTTIYVNARHRSVHYEGLARDILGHLPSRGARVVDYGCGDALSADRIAEACEQLFLCDGAPRVRERLVDRHSRQPNIAVIAPQQFERLPPGTIDLIVVNSLVQYLTRSELSHLLEVSREKLTVGGRLLLADVIPPHLGPLRDAAELLRFAGANRFLLSAAGGLARAFFSNYRTIRNRCGFLRLDESEVLGLLAQAGFVARRHFPNLGHNVHRMTFLGVPGGASEATLRNSREIRPARHGLLVLPSSANELPTAPAVSASPPRHGSC